MGLLQNELFRIIAGNSAAWFLVIFIPGTIIQRLPLRLFREDAFLFRIRRWEREGRIYRSLGIKWWKELLPDGAGIFQDGFRKKRMHGMDQLYLKRFILETCRAELVHWVIIGLIPLFFTWNPLEVAVWMVPFGLLVNLPCLLTQRFNRPRLIRMQRKA
ncbi:MAG: glycosyl-4,4'-diaponeurosporenoate acyltransferase [Sediminispirochaetaceae bacterium]